MKYQVRIMKISRNQIIILLTVLFSFLLVSVFAADVSFPVRAENEDRTRGTDDLCWKGNVIVHRGYYTAPQNSLQSLLEAKKEGFTMCEVDPRESADGAIVMNHDETVSSGGKTYRIDQTDSEDLFALSIGNDRFPDARLCSLEEMLDLCNLTGMPLKIDQKVRREEFEEKVVKTVMRYGLQDQCIFTCADINYARAVKAIYPTANCSINYEKLSSDTTLDKYTPYSDMYVEIPVSEIDEDSLGILMDEVARGYKIYVYDVSHDQIKTAMRAKPCHIEPVSGEEKYDFYELIEDYASDKYSELEWE